MEIYQNFPVLPADWEALRGQRRVETFITWRLLGSSLYEFKCDKLVAVSWEVNEDKSSNCIKTNLQCTI